MSWVRVDPESIVQDDIRPGNTLVIKCTEESEEFTLPTPDDESVPRVIYVVGHCDTEMFTVNTNEISASTGVVFAWCTMAWTTPF
jgi:hypothetical protein